MTLASGPSFLARYRDVPPTPQPTSRIFLGTPASLAARPPHSAIWSTKSNLAWMKSLRIDPCGNGGFGYACRLCDRFERGGRSPTGTRSQDEDSRNRHGRDESGQPSALRYENTLSRPTVLRLQIHHAGRARSPGPEGITRPISREISRRNGGLPGRDLTLNRGATIRSMATSSATERSLSKPQLRTVQQTLTSARSMGPSFNGSISDEKVWKVAVPRLAAKHRGCVGKANPVRLSWGSRSGVVGGGGRSLGWRVGSSSCGPRPREGSFAPSSLRAAPSEGRIARGKGGHETTSRDPILRTELGSTSRDGEDGEGSQP